MFMTKYLPLSHVLDHNSLQIKRRKKAIIAEPAMLRLRLYGTRSRICRLLLVRTRVERGLGFIVWPAVMAVRDIAVASVASVLGIGAALLLAGRMFLGVIWDVGDPYDE